MLITGKVRILVDFVRLILEAQKPLYFIAVAGLLEFWRICANVPVVLRRAINQLILLNND
jgi:hypothetical protein